VVDGSTDDTMMGCVVDNALKLNDSLTMHSNMGGE
jgi:hypothetical protein